MKLKAKAFIIIFILSAALALGACSAQSSLSPNEALKNDFVSSAERKIVYSASFSIVSKEFGQDILFVENSLEEDEWFDSASYYEDNAYFRARVKTSRLDEYLNMFSSHFGSDNIENFQRQATDVSLDYYDKQGKIESLEAERGRLNELMSASGTTISDIILINKRLSEVEYELQQLKGELYRFDSALDYSIVDIAIRKPSYAWVVLLVMGGIAILTAIIVPTVFHLKKKRSNSTIQNIPHM